MCSVLLSGFPDSLLQDTYSKTTVITSILAIILSQMSAWIRPHYGLTTIFTIAAAAAIMDIILLFLLWERNTGHGPPQSTTRPEGLNPNFAMRLLGLLITSIVQAFSQIQVNH